MSSLVTVKIYTRIHCIPLLRVLDQHKLTPEQWEERILNWWIEHKSMLRYCTIHCSKAYIYTLYIYMYVVERFIQPRALLVQDHSLT